MQESFDRLARLLEVPGVSVPRLNPSVRGSALTPEQVDLFRERNRLDYLIYEAAVRRFRGACGGGG